jgi:peptidoglycan hydrolase-like protein with peptidoglycan-binding domain
MTMTRSARPLDRDRGADRSDRPGAAGGLPIRAAELAMRHPLATGAGLLSVVMFGIIAGNALANQPARHPHPMFSTRSLADPQGTGSTAQPAVSTPGGPIALPRPKPVSQMDQPQILQELQAALRDRGYYSGPVDGVLGPATGEAIKAFERRLGVTPTGEPNELLLAALRNIAPAADTMVTGSLPPVQPPVVQPTPPQPRVAAQTAPARTAPARTTAATPAPAVAQQPVRYAAVDGVAYPVGGDDTAAVEADPQVVTGAIRRAAREPLAPGGDERLQKIQRALVGAGYGPLKADGRWDEKSQGAVRRYEVDHGWTQTGKPTDKLVYGLMLDAPRARR